jgi:nucleotide-binding universal stress UspA family protein
LNLPVIATSEQNEESVMSTDTRNHHRIVVGIDGSKCSMRALQWGLQQAELTGASVQVVIAWHWPTTTFGVPMAPYSPVDNAEKIVEETLDPVREEYPSIEIDSTVIEGHPAPVLIEAAIGADLLVVGSRGHGEFVGMLLGSVSEHCVSHAPCPVLVFRGENG